MALDLEIQSLLRSIEVQQINFTMAGIRISGHGFFELSNCFSDQSIRHRIRVTVRPQMVGTDAQASYTPDDDKIHLRSLSVLHTVSGRAELIHECTHAQLDLRAVSASILSEEGAAFIAEAWYYLACDQSSAMVLAGVPNEIVTIADNIRTQSQVRGGAAISLTPEQINIARRAMRLQGYSTGHYTSNGIRGYRYRGN